MQPSVTVLVCTRNRSSLLRRCVEALLDGVDRPDAIFVVDQSDDGDTRAVVDELVSRPGGEVLQRIPSPGGGMAVGQNLGFRHVTTDVVAVTDDDCIPSPAWVATVRRAFASDGSLSLVAGRVIAVATSDPDRHAVSTRTSTVAAELDGSSMPWDVGSGNNFALRMAALRAIGGNDERLGPGAPLRGGADMDLFRRALRSGGRGRYEPELVVEHETATREERLGRRVPYGYGMGVACALWFRQGDRAALEILRRWLAMRGRRLARGVRHDRPLAHEELLVLAGTARGLGRGLVLRPASPRQTERVT